MAILSCHVSIKLPPKISDGQQNPDGAGQPSLLGNPGIGARRRLGAPRWHSASIWDKAAASPLAYERQCPWRIPLLAPTSSTAPCAPVAAPTKGGSQPPTGPRAVSTPSPSVRSAVVAPLPNPRPTRNSYPSVGTPSRPWSFAGLANPDR